MKPLTDAPRTGYRVHCDRYGRSLAQQAFDNPEDEGPAYGPLPRSFHVHFCGVDSCQLEFICTDNDCKLDIHNCAEKYLDKCEGCDIALQIANGVV